MAFGCPLANSYGASEFLASPERAHGAPHRNADWVLLELVDAALPPRAARTCGEKVWLTNPPTTCSR